jgi:hypothetical protein
MQRFLRLDLAVPVVVLVLIMLPAHAMAVCGDGFLEASEECDPGGSLFVQGNPANPMCTSGDDCFFETTCCKFNCQYANPGPCFDGNDCTVTDACDNVGNCLGGALAPEGQACDDGLYCTVDTTCDAGGACVGGTSPCTFTDCVTMCDEGTQSCLVNEGGPCTDDGNACTDDVCDAGGACTHPDNAAPCDDGTFCNGADTCSGGTCSAHAGDPCIAGGQCSNVCDEALDTCDLPDGTACDDGQFCTAVDECSSGSCVGSGDPCMGGDECNDVCDELADSCADPHGVPCTDDGNGCTDDVCDGAGSCAHEPNSAPCDDGLLCTLVDTCEGGVCVGAVPPECQDDNPCTYDTCDDGTGECLNLAEPAPSCQGEGEPILSQLVIGNRDDTEGRDKLKWKWGRIGIPTPAEDFGDPLTTTDFDLCIFDTTMGQPRIAAHLKVPHGAAWRQKGGLKWIFKDKVGDPDGVTIVKLRSGSRPALGLKASRDNLALTAFSSEKFFDMDSEVTAQLISNEGPCWTTTFLTAKKNTSKKFRTKVRGVVIH